MVEMPWRRGEHRESAGAGDAKGAVGKDPSQGVPAPCGDVSLCRGLSQTPALHFPTLPSAGDAGGGTRTFRHPTVPHYAQSPAGACKALPCVAASLGVPQNGGAGAAPTSRLCFGSMTVLKARAGTERLHLQNTPVILLFLNYVFLTLTSTGQMPTSCQPCNMLL